MSRFSFYLTSALAAIAALSVATSGFCDDSQKSPANNASKNKSPVVAEKQQATEAQKLKQQRNVAHSSARQRAKSAADVWAAMGSHESKSTAADREAWEKESKTNNDDRWTRLKNSYDR